MSELSISVLPGEYALCRLNPTDIIPSWIYLSAFYTISKSPDELSVVAETKFVAEGIKCDKDWKLLKIEAVLDLSLTGITAKFSTALANEDINLCVIATYDTDYIMIKEEKLAKAKEALQYAGFIINP